MKYLFMKVETTGLDANDEVLAVNCIQRDTDTCERSEASFLIKPQYRMDWPGAFASHEIAPEDVANSPSMDEFTSSLRFMIDKADAVVGINLPFDFRMLAQSGFAVPDNPKYIDIGQCQSARMAIREYGDYNVANANRRYSLNALCDAYAVDNPPAIRLEKLNIIEDVFDAMTANEAGDNKTWEGKHPVAAMQPVSLAELGIDFPELIKTRNTRYLKDDYRDMVLDDTLFPKWMNQEDRLETYGECITSCDMDEEAVRKSVSDSVVQNLTFTGITDFLGVVASYSYRGNDYYRMYNTQQLSAVMKYKESSLITDGFRAEEKDRAMSDGFEFWDANHTTHIDRLKLLAELTGHERPLPELPSGLQPIAGVMRDMMYNQQGMASFISINKNSISYNPSELHHDIADGYSIPLEHMMVEKGDTLFVPTDMMTMFRTPTTVASMLGDVPFDVEIPKPIPYTWHSYDSVVNEKKLEAHKGDNPFKVTVLYSGSKGNATLLETGDKKYLIDVGVKYTTQLLPALKKVKVKPNEIDGVFITHEHIDHINGLLQLMKKMDCPVYASEGTWEGVRKRFPTLHSNQGYLMPKALFLDGITVERISTCHDVREPNGFKFHKDGYNFTYVTDTGRATAEVKEAVWEADTLVLEANHSLTMLQENRNYSDKLKWRIAGSVGHLSNEDTVALLKETRAKTVYLAHLSEENNMPEVLAGRVGKESDTIKANIIITKQDNMEVEMDKTRKKLAELAKKEGPVKGDAN